MPLSALPQSQRNMRRKTPSRVSALLSGIPIVQLGRGESGDQAGGEHGLAPAEGAGGCGREAEGPGCTGTPSPRAAWLRAPGRRRRRARPSPLVQRRAGRPRRVTRAGAGRGGSERRGRRGDGLRRRLRSPSSGRRKMVELGPALEAAAAAAAAEVPACAQARGSRLQPPCPTAAC